MAKIPASIRTNNPGAMYPGPAATKFGSARYEVLSSKDGTHQIAIFDNPVLGAAAMFYLLGSKTYTGRTIQQAIAKWCGGFYVSAYIKVLEEKGHVTRDTNLTRDLVLIPDVAIPLAQAMAFQEAGVEYPLSKEQWEQAHGIAFGRIPMETVVPEEAPRSRPVDDGSTQPIEVPAAPAAIVVPAAPVRSSGTIWSSIAAFSAWLLANIEAGVQFGLQWVAELSALSPLSGLVTAAGANVKAWSTGMFIGSLLMVVTRRIKAATEGKAG